MTAEIEKKLTELGRAICPDEAIVKGVMGRIEAMEVEKPTQARDAIWRIIMKSRITRLAVAAGVVAIFGILAYRHTGSIDGASVSWANVLEKVESAGGFKVQMKCRIEGVPDTNLVAYDGGENGSKIETYIGGKLTSIMIMKATEKKIYQIIPSIKKYSTIELNEQSMNKNYGAGGDPRQFLKLFLSEDHNSLGESFIDGVRVEGIETNSPKFAGGMFGKTTAKLWVNAETELPVRMELNGSMGDKEMQMDMYGFEWNVHFNNAFFEPNIPADYTSLGEVKLPEVNEGGLIDGLEKFRELSGRYPKSLITGDITKEAGEVIKGIDVNDKAAFNQKTGDMLKVLGAGMLYQKLVQEGNEPEYYGESVAAGDANSVLLEWKIGKNKRRLIYGDLRTETVLK